MKELISNLSHDLRTPLTTIYGSSSTIVENYRQLSEEQLVQLADGIREDAGWLIGMVENILSITRIDNEGVKIVKTPISLEELIDLRELYGVSIAAQVHEAWDLRLISRQHYDWWYEELIKKNVKEEGWGSYRFPETLGREKRMRAIIKVC